MKKAILQTNSFSPDPTKIFPKPGDRKICYLKNVITNPAIQVGDFTLYHDFTDPTTFETANVLYHYPINQDRLIIGKFCSIACGSKFIMNGANHKMESFTTYPFPIVVDDWQSGHTLTDAWDNKGDIVIGNDVWIGYESLVYAGVHIGDGAIVASRSIVSRDVPPFTIVGGTAARVIKKRFPDDIIDLLSKIKWWDWEYQKIRENIPVLFGRDEGALRRLAVNQLSMEQNQ